MSSTPSSKQPPGGPSPELVTALKALTPAQRAQAIAMAAKLLARKAHRNR